MSKTDINLESEARVLAPIFKMWRERQLLVPVSLSDVDLVGAFILSYAATRRPNRWAGGSWKIQCPVETSSVQTPPRSVLVRDVCGLVEILNEKYLKRIMTLESIDSLTIADIFYRVSLAGIKKNCFHYINHSMVQWYRGTRPYDLLFYIPTPNEVLRQQARGRRVITMLTENEELVTRHEDKLMYMDGSHSHKKCCFEFLLHDMKHMENFIDKDIHSEQVGFFNCMLQLPRSFFREQGFDGLLWSHLEYLIADMNCYSTHLLRYLLAKLILAVKRLEFCTLESTSSSDLTLNERGLERLESVWSAILQRFGLPDSSTELRVCLKLLHSSMKSDEALNAEEWEVVRAFFKTRLESQAQI